MYRRTAAQMTTGHLESCPTPREHQRSLTIASTLQKRSKMREGSGNLYVHDQRDTTPRAAGSKHRASTRVPRRPTKPWGGLPCTTSSSLGAQRSVASIQEESDHSSVSPKQPRIQQETRRRAFAAHHPLHKHEPNRPPRRSKPNPRAKHNPSHARCRRTQGRCNLP